LSSKVILLLIFCIIASACGFQPLYSTGGSENIIADFSRIRVASTKDRIGQLLSNELKHLLNPLYTPTNPKYRLVTTLSVSVRPLAIKKTALATRSNLTVSSSHQLIETTGRKILSTGSNTITVSYNIYSAHYATLSAEKDAKKRAIKNLAQEIRLQLGAFFKAQNKLNIFQ
jgi:LPS-assembly lipoprotein